MDKMTFASYKFKPSDVIEGLNRYFAETKAFRNRRVPLNIRNGEVKRGNDYVIRNIVFYVSTPKIKECGYYYVICDPEEVVGVAINWLREEHDIFYTPGMEAPVEDFDVNEAAKEYEKATRTSDIFCEENLDVVPVARVREALGIAEDSDIFEGIEFLKKSNERAHSRMYKARGEKYELLKQVREILGLNPEVNLFDTLRRARGDMDATTRLRLESSELRHQNHQFGRRLSDIRQAAGMADDDPTDLVKYVEALREKAGENSVLRSNLDYFAGLAQSRQTELSNLRYEILINVYREIFDCSNGDPEGSDAEILQDILTEYKRTLELKNIAEEKAIKWKELAKENRVQWNNRGMELQWAQKENLEWVKRYEKLKNERNQFGKRLADIRKAAGMADDDPTDLVKYIESHRGSEEKYFNMYVKFTKLSEERDRYKGLYENLKNGVESVLQEAEDKED